jgi:hypothetical protein
MSYHGTHVVAIEIPEGDRVGTADGTFPYCSTIVNAGLDSSECQEFFSAGFAHFEHMAVR